MATNIDNSSHLSLEGGILFSNCNANTVRIEKTYLVTPSIGHMP